MRAEPLQSGLPKRPTVVSATAALAALSVALLLTMPAVAAGTSTRPTPTPDTARLTLEQLRDSLNEAARALAGVEKPSVRPQVAVIDRPTLRVTLRAERFQTLTPDTPHRPHATPLRASLLNLPPPTR